MKKPDKLGREFAKLGHEVTHVSRLCDDLPQEETCFGVRHLRVPGANAVEESMAIESFGITLCFACSKSPPESRCLDNYAFWAPILLPSKRLGNMYAHVGRYQRDKMKLYRRPSACRHQALRFVMQF